MFRKIISNLSFSPALVWQLGSYSKIIQKEEITRRLSLIFMVLALVVQSLIVFQPPEPANASSPNDMVNGGIGSSIDNFLSPYDSNTRHLKDITEYAGITRDEITSSKFSSWKTDEKISWGLLSHFSSSQDERQYNVSVTKGQQPVIFYSRPLKLLYNTDTTIQGWVGNSAKLGWFGIMQDNGNLVTDTAPSLLTTKCNIDSLCTPEIIKSTTANNISQGLLEADSLTTVASDQISYTITAENTGTKAVTLTLEDNLSDILEYSTLIDNGGGILDDSTGVLSWPNITFEPKSKQTRTFIVKIFDEIPATAQGVSNPVSFDCTITNTFGNSIDITVDCPAQKTVEKIVNTLPQIGLLGNIIFAIIVTSLIVYLYLRARLLKQETRIIRKDSSSGTI